VGIVTEIVSRVSVDERGERLALKGPVRFDDRSFQHLQSDLLPLVDRITEALDVPRKNFEVSAVTPGAAASAGIGVEISGFSADLPMLLALLSSSLQLGLRQDVISSGHVASLEGDIAAVRGIPAKIEAALAFPGISAFVLPDLEKDRSLELLTPLEYQSAKEALSRYKGDITIHSIGGVDDAIRVFTTDESIVLGSLRAGFFDGKAAIMEQEGPLGRSVAILARGNEKRFWAALEHCLLNRHFEKARLLLRSFVDFHVKDNRYPENFGERLLRMVISLPPSTRRLDDLFPLISMGLCIGLSQHTQKNDHEDLKRLYKAASGEDIGPLPYPDEPTGKKLSTDAGKEDNLIERLLAELSEENLAGKIGLPLDEARACYVMDEIRVKDGFEFNDVITAFYAHMFRHAGSPAGHVDRMALSAEAVDLVKKAFERKGGYNAALSEGMHGSNGGMRLVLDVMTEYLKQQGKEKYIARLFKEIIDPLDWDAKVRLTEDFLKRIGPELPPDLQGLPPKKLASHWETILEHYAEAMAKMTDLLKRL